MSSTSRNEVWLSAGAKEFLAQLPPPEQRRLALLLLVLKKNAFPEESRALTADGAADESMRIWCRGAYEILYQVNGRIVEVGILRHGS